MAGGGTFPLMHNKNERAWRDRNPPWSSNRLAGKNEFPWKAVITSVVLTVAATLLVLNFSPGEKRLDQQLPRL